ncbi:Core-binding (CB) domain-containing protein, partial [Dysosmobacter welbionis]
ARRDMPAHGVGKRGRCPDCPAGRRISEPAGRCTHSSAPPSASAAGAAWPAEPGPPPASP